MSVQYIFDEKGETTGVFIPIEEWNSVKEKFHDVDYPLYDIPQWHKDELDRRLEAIENGTTEFHDFDEAMDEIEREG